MFKLLIVDDEPEIRAHIKDLIDWDKMDMLLVGEAGDADSAMEIFYMSHPQIVIMDICLPGQDGLSLAKELLSQNPDIKIIIVSSYQDFAYAKSAIAIGVFQYLTKPIIAEDLNECLSKIAEEFISKREENKKMYALHQVLEQNRAMLQQWQVESLISGDISASEEQVRRQIDLLEMEMNAQYFSVIIISIKKNNDVNLASGFQSATLKQYTATKMRESGFGVYCFFDENRNLCCLLNRMQPYTNEFLERICLSLYNELKSYFDQTICIGIGDIQESLVNISVSAKQAKAALQNAMLLECEQVVCHTNISVLNVPTVVNVPQVSKWVPQVMLYIQERREQEIETIIQTICGQLSTEVEFQEFGVEFLGELSKVCSEYGIYPWNTIDYPVMIRQIFNCNEREKFYEILISLCKRLVKLVHQKNYSENHRLIEKAKHYIGENYSDANLSLEQVSSHVGVSKSYFCSLFHKFEGMTFKAYLMELRMRHARRLLAFSEKKIYEISCEVGCSDSAYFNRMFKRVTGMTPLQYRNSGKKE